MTEPTSGNPGPSRQVDVSAFLPWRNKLEQADQEEILRSHAHLVAVYYSALLAEGVDFHLAETLTESWSEDTLKPIESDEKEDG